MAKRKSKKEKQKTHEVDEFVGTMHRIGERLKPHLVPLAVAFGGLTVILVSYYTYNWWQQRKERKATTALAKALDVADRKVQDFAPAPDPNDPNHKPIVYKTRQERAQAVLEALKKVDPSTDVGRNAMLLRAGALYDLGKYDEALKAYRSVANSGAAAEVKRIAREGIGLSLEGQANKTKSNDGFQQALDAFRKIDPGKKGPGHNLALFHEGRMLARLGKKQEAIATFEKLTKVKPPSMFTPDAERRLAELQSNDTYPKPKPKKATKPDDKTDKNGGDNKPANDNKPAGDKKPANDNKPAGNTPAHKAPAKKAPAKKAPASK